MSDIFEKILYFQNELLLKKIADYKFNCKIKKDEFIKKYHKINYQKVDVVRDDTLFKIYFKKYKTKNIK
jgi:hypothetical protein